MYVGFLEFGKKGVCELMGSGKCGDGSDGVE